MPTVTLASLKYSVYSKLEQNTLFYPASEVTNAINEAIRITNAYSGYLQATVTIISVQNRVWYLVPAGVLLPLRCQYEGTYLKPVSVRTVGQSNPNWIKTTTATAQTPPQNWIPLGLDKFGLYPADATGGALIQITGVMEPAPLVNDTDTIPLSNEMYTEITDYSVNVLQIKEGSSVLAQAATWYTAFMARMVRTSIWKGLTQPIGRLQAPMSYGKP